MEWEEKEHERRQAIAAARGQAVEEEDASAEQQFVAYVPLPDQKEIEQRVLEKKKQDLLAKYTSESLRKEQEEAKLLLRR